jgi:hypothetical protein
MAEEERETAELEDDELDARHGEELPDREVLSVLEPMNPAAPVGGEVVQPPPPDA